MKSLRCGQHIIKLTNTDRLYFPPNITKQQLIEYYFTIAPLMLPYIKHRLMTMQRFPQGITGQGFYHKDTPAFFPSFIPRYPLKNSDGSITRYLACNNQATLIYLANYGCITPHVWLSRIDALHKPDRMIFDFDPSIPEFDDVRQAAFDCKKICDHLGLSAYPILTGSRGLHLIIPLKRYYTFSQVKQYAQAIAQQMIEEHPERYTMQVRKDKRGKKVFIDTLRNNYGATAVAPYAVRALPGAPVAMPITWEQLADKAIHSQSFTIFTVNRSHG